MARVSSAHHVLGIKHLLRELRHRECAVLLRAAGSERREASHEEVQPGERDEINGDLAQVAVQLPREAQACGHAAHRRAHQVVEVTIGGCGQLQGAEADVVERLIVEQEALVGIFDELVKRQDGVVGFHHGVADLWRGDNAEGLHDPIRVLLANFRNQQCAHAGAGAAAEGMAQLETLQAIATLGLLADNIQDRIDQLGPLGVMSFRPIVTRAGLSKDEIVGAEKLTERTGSDAVHGARLESHEDGARHIAATGGFVKIYVDALKLKVGISMIRSRGINTMFIGNHLPELRADLIAALASLDVHQLTHG
mmetsp:Transcript_155898/g.498249  ORF Transcript_155898/g.498249 Transcript_155898/m.498249 type:complete len:309 (+) Transcript_155898:166-1092(+)